MKYHLVVTYVNDILNQYTIRLTLRQIYYRLVAGYGYPNTNSAYTQLSKQLVEARKRGDIDETRIEDRSREFLGEDYGWDGPEDFVTYRFKWFFDSPDYYSRKMWSSQPEFVVVWVEKDALSRVISAEADKYNVITCPSRGYASYTYIKEALKMLPADKHITVLHFADHDPSGIDMTRDLKERFHEYSSLDINLERIALTHDQVQHYRLPPNPTKRADPRADSYIAKFGNECWELDAIEPMELQRMVLEAIVRHVDFSLWNQTLEQIQQEREDLRAMFSSIKDLLLRYGYHVLSNS